MYEITTLHPFIEGNKRTGFTCADMFLVINDHLLVASPEEGTEILLKVARMEMERSELIIGSKRTPSIQGRSSQIKSWPISVNKQDI